MHEVPFDGFGGDNEKMSDELKNRETESTEGDKGLSPKFLDDYKGPEKTKLSLRLFIQLAIERSEALDHMLLLSRSSSDPEQLAMIIANELGVRIRIPSDHDLEGPGELAALLTNLQSGDVLFIKDIHRISPNIEAVLCPAINDFALDIMIGKGPSARSVRLDLPVFTIIGSTPSVELLSDSLRECFSVQLSADNYTRNSEELSHVIRDRAMRFGLTIDDGAIQELHLRSNGRQEKAKQLFKYLQAAIEIRHESHITKTFAVNILDTLVDNRDESNEMHFMFRELYSNIQSVLAYQEEMRADISRILTQFDLDPIEYELESPKEYTFREHEFEQNHKSSSWVERIFPILDDFERAMNVQVNNSETKSFLQGIKIIYRNLDEVLKELFEKEGIAEIEAEWTPFDPKFHDAVMQVDTEYYPPNTVVEVMQKGYLRGDRVIRPALVKVSRYPDS